MGQSLAKIYLHVIFSTKNREKLLSPDIRKELHPYLASVLTHMNCFPIEVSGVADHIHILCSLAKGLAIEDLIAKIKPPSSKWIKQWDRRLHNFHWQNGYGAFSVSPSQLHKVREYLLKQGEHHQKETFEDEYRKFLKRYQIEYDERYVWD